MAKRKKSDAKAPKDFQRIKRRVGKTLKPANVTNTQIRSRAISMPTQALHTTPAVDSADIVNERGNSLSVTFLFNS